MTAPNLTEEEIQKLQEDSYWQILELEAKNREFEEYAHLLTKQQTKMKEVNNALRAEIMRSKRITEELILSHKKAEQANIAKSEFLANISHELRTPMHAILSYAGMGMSRGKRIDRQKLSRYFETIHTSGTRLLVLLDDLLDLSKLEAGQMKTELHYQDCRPIVVQVTRELQESFNQANITLDFKKQNICTHSLIDSSQICQVLTNLLSNAIKYSPHQSTISISFSHLQNREKNPMLCCTITDRGIGIPVQELESIFDQFIQSSKTATGSGGTGLGLSICKKIIINHGGEIWAEQRDGGGSVFRFTTRTELL